MKPIRLALLGCGTVGEGVVRLLRTNAAMFERKLGAPLELADLQRLVPTGNSFKRLKDWVLNYINQEFYWDLQCVVKAAAVPAISLGQGALLGWTTWLKSEPFTRDPDDAIFDPETL